MLQTRKRLAVIVSVPADQQYRLFGYQTNDVAEIVLMMARIETLMTRPPAYIPPLWGKRGRSLVLPILFLVICLLPYHAMAQVDTLAVIGNTGKADSKGHIVQLTLMNIHEIAGLQLTLETSHKIIAIDSVRTTPRSNGMMAHWNRVNGKIILIDFNATHAINIGYGPVLEVFYSISADASPGMVPLKMNIINMFLYMKIL